jgi:hypothetical protein
MKPHSKQGGFCAIDNIYYYVYTTFIVNLTITYERLDYMSIIRNPFYTSSVRNWRKRHERQEENNSCLTQTQMKLRLEVARREREQRTERVANQCVTRKHIGLIMEPKFTKKEVLASDRNPKKRRLGKSDLRRMMNRGCK